MNPFSHWWLTRTGSIWICHNLPSKLWKTVIQFFSQKRLSTAFSGRAVLRVMMAIECVNLPIQKSNKIRKREQVHTRVKSSLVIFLSDTWMSGARAVAEGFIWHPLFTYSIHTIAIELQWPWLQEICVHLQFYVFWYNYIQSSVTRTVTITSDKLHKAPMNNY